MAKKLLQIFTTDELKKIVDDKTSCVTVHKSVYNLQLYPYHLTDIGSSIKELLNSKVAKYDQKLNGILLGYKNITLLTPQGSIFCDSCFIHIDIEADFYLFKPEIDSLLTGVVNKKIDDHVGCLVHRLFNVSVPNNNEEDWAGHNVSIGDELILKIVYIDLDARLPYIKAQLVEIKTKVKKQEEFNEDDEEDFRTSEETPKKKKKKRDKIKFEESSTQEESDNETNKPVKKMKKKIKKETDEVAELETDNGSQADLKLNESLTKKKKKVKVKKDNSNIEVELETNNNESQEDLKLDESLTKKKKKVKLEHVESDNQNTKLENKKKRKSTEIITKKSNQSDTEEINVFQRKEMISKSKINGSYPDLNDESITKKKKKNKLENLEADKQINSKQSENKKKRKSTEKKMMESNDSNKIHKENGHDKIIGDTLQTEEMLNNILNYEKLNEKSPKGKKRSKSEEHKSKRDSTSNLHADLIFMADREDRKSKKRKSSLGQSIIWDNKELDLHDSELEKTLGESWKPPVDESLKFNLVKIAALNESNKLTRNSNTEAELEDFKAEKKRKRKSNEGEPKSKKKKVQNEAISEDIKKKSKSLKVKT